MIVYDAQARASFDSLTRWIEQVDEAVDGSIVKMIVAAKSEGGSLAVSAQMAHSALFSLLHSPRSFTHQPSSLHSTRHCVPCTW